MAAPFRIERASTRTSKLEELNAPDPNQGFKEYLGRLLKMIPGEIVGLYMIGKGFIPAEQKTVHIIWPAICLVLLIILRLWGTKDPAANKPSQPVPVAIAAIAFIIWLFWLGGPYVPEAINKPFIASLLVLVWSFIIPIFYKGDQEA